jgi:hypothetical protein
MARAPDSRLKSPFTTSDFRTRTGDRRDLPTADVEQIGRRRVRASAVVGIDVREPLAEPRAPDQNGRHTGLGQDARERVVAVERHEDHTVDVPLP